METSTASCTETVMYQSEETSGISSSFKKCAESPLLMQISPPGSPLSLDELSDDVIHHILSFVSSVKSLAHFAFTSRRARMLVFDSFISDSYFEVLYRNSFGYDGAMLKGGREQWKSLHRLRECLLWNAHQKNHKDNRKTLGIFSPEEEAEAILYDNPSEEAEQIYCIGYFGWHPLKDDGPVLVWGDYNGVRVAPSLNELLIKDAQDEAPGSGDQSTDQSRQQMTQFEAVGDRDGGFQVLTVLESPNSCDEVSFFLGFASGMVTAVKMTLSPEREHVYTTKSTSSVHTSEVTALALLPVDNPCLISGSVDGKVYIYPHSMKGSLEVALLACSLTGTNVPGIFSIGAVSWNDGGVLLCTGDSVGKVALWQASHVPKVYKSGDSYPFRQCSVSLAASFDEERVLVTQVLFLHNDSKTLVSGTNAGEIRFWDITTEDSELPWGEFEYGPRLRPKHIIGAAHTGTIESIKVVGNILLTSGGNDGRVRGWDVNTGKLIDCIQVHPGVKYPPEPQPGRKGLKSAVVSTLVCHDRECLVSLCRDGTMHEWSYRQDQHESLKRLSEQSQRKQHKRKRIGSLGSSEYWEWNEDTAFKNAASLIAERKQQMVKDLSQIMNNETESQFSTASMRFQMQRSIIHAAFRHCCETPKSCTVPCPFIGADYCIYSDIRAAFDLFGGISPCSQCETSDHGAYSCRLCDKHSVVDNDDGDPEAKVFLKSLMRSKKIAPVSSPDIAVHARRASSTTVDQICTRCQLENKPNKERCAECYGPRERRKRNGSDDKERDPDAEPPTKLLSDADSVSQKQSANTDECVHNSAPVANGSTSITAVHVWECYECAYKNPWRKYICVACGSKGGGMEMVIEKDASLEVSSVNAGAADRQIVQSPAVSRLKNRKEKKKKCSPEMDFFFNIPIKDIHNPHPNDVLCGRKINHVGNETFRALVDHQKPYYLHATTEEGNFISLAVVRAVRSQVPPGRFLQKDTSTGLWRDIGDAAAALKAGKLLWEVRRKRNARGGRSRASAPRATARTEVRAEVPSAALF